MEKTKLVAASLLFILLFASAAGTVFGIDVTDTCGNDRGPAARVNDEERNPPTPPTPPTTPKPPTVTEILCRADTDCYGGYICCIGKCRDSSTGVCKDINGDGVLDWVPYSSSENSQAVMGSVFDGVFHLIASFLGFSR